MAYLGKEIQYTSFLQDTFSGNGVLTQFTLTETPGSSSGLIVNIGGVLQEPEYAYTVTNNIITFTEAVPAGTNNINVVHLGITVEINTPSDNSITLSKLATSITNLTNDSLAGDGIVNTFTLSKAPASANSIIVSIDGALQKPSDAYTLSDTSLVFTEVPADGVVISVLHLGISYNIGVPSDGSVGTTQLANGSVTAAKMESGELPFSKSFVSTEQTITSAGSLTLPHSLGEMPTLIQPRIICKVAEGGYSIGDEVLINPFSNQAGASDRGLSIYPDATNIGIRYSDNATVFGILNKASGDALTATNANWKFIIRAWA